MCFCYTDSEVQVTCETQPPLNNDVLEIPLHGYAIMICEHEFNDSITILQWDLKGLQMYFEHEGDPDLRQNTWEEVNCLFVKNKTCNQIFVIIAPTSKDLHNVTTSGCVLLEHSHQCDEKNFLIKILPGRRLHSKTSKFLTHAHLSVTLYEWEFSKGLKFFHGLVYWP